MHISKYQLFCLVLLFEVGSSTLFAMGIDAKQDAWIAIFCAMIISLGIIWCYTELQKFYPEKNLTEIIIEVLGKVIGRPLCFLYGLFFLYASIRNLKDFSILMDMTFLKKTPEIVINFLFIAIAIYYVLLGIEVIGRTSEIMFPLVMFFILSVHVMIALSTKISFSALQPVLSGDIKPMLSVIYPFLVNFPFCESFVFIMFWKYINSTDNIRNTMFLSIIISSLLIAVTTSIIICVIGIGYASIAAMPLLALIKLINVANILTNLESFGVTIMIVGGFYKMLLFFYGAVLCFSTLFKVKSNKWIIIICAVFEVWIAETFESNYSYHIWLGHKISLPYIHNTFQVIIPVLLLSICWLKTKMIKKCKIRQ